MTITITLMSSQVATLSSPPPTFPLLPPTNSLTFPSLSLPYPSRCPTKRLVLASQVALKSDSSIDESDPELKSNLDKVGRKVQLKSPITVYHIPKVDEFELTPDMVGVVKQYVGYWKGKRISPNLPFKVEYNVEIQGRGNVKVVAHLKDDEFDVVD